MNPSELSLPSPGSTVPVMIPGPAGDLEAMVSAPGPAGVSPYPRGICVVSHPHPLYGGAMTNKVVWTLAHAAGKAGLAVARFNFRGVGKSEGLYDNAVGETEDVLAVVEWLRARAPEAPLLLAGFSFGAYVSIKAAGAAKPAALVTIAPPFGRYIDNSLPPPRPECPWLAVHSTDDDTVAYAETRAVLEAYAPPPQLVTFESAGHFFHGQLGPLQDAVQPFIESHFPA